VNVPWWVPIVTLVLGGAISELSRRLQAREERQRRRDDYQRSLLAEIRSILPSLARPYRPHDWRPFEEPDSNIRLFDPDGFPLAGADPEARRAYQANRDWEEHVEGQDRRWHRLDHCRLEVEDSVLRDGLSRLVSADRRAHEIVQAWPPGSDLEDLDEAVGPVVHEAEELRGAAQARIGYLLRRLGTAP
jgi:hypothetical protein